MWMGHLAMKMNGNWETNHLLNIMILISQIITDEIVSENKKRKITMYTDLAKNNEEIK